MNPVQSPAASASLAQAGAAPVRNVVLVHGGFVDGSGWEPVYKLLKKDGYNVRIVQNPTVSLADDVAVTQRAIAAMDGPVILVGHSYGGVVVSEAGTNPQVKGVVYIAAFAPDKGESVQSLIANPAARRAGAADPAAAGRLPVARSREVRRGLRGGCRAAARQLHGRLAGALGPRRARRARSANPHGASSRAGTWSPPTTA